MSLNIFVSLCQAAVSSTCSDYKSQMALLSNAAMYHKTWATFVDGAISKHHQNTNDGGAGNSSDGRVGSGRIDLQDVMRVEEILVRIERAEGGWIDYERRLDGDDGADADASSLASGSLLRSSGRCDRVKSWSLLRTTPRAVPAGTHNSQRSSGSGTRCTPKICNM